MEHSARDGSLKISGLEVIRVRVSPRGNWTFVRLRTAGSLSGLGEASHGAGFTRASDGDDARMRAAIEALFPLVEGRLPFDVEAFREAAWSRVRRDGLLHVTAFSAIEQAMWDLAGKALHVPVYNLLGGKLRDTIPVYANINRAVRERSPEDFARQAAEAAAEGFVAIKAAPFDDFPAPGSERSRTCEPGELDRLEALGLRRIAAIRRAIGPRIKLMIDCHSRFESERAIRIARELEPLDLAWYEEPVDPQQIEATKSIHDAISQRLAGGEILFGAGGFEPLCRTRAVDIIMPDVKHCGGILEGKKIAALAEAHGVEFSPHNPSGPVATAASAQLAAGLPNFSILEYAWGEAEWRSQLVVPPERFENGCLPLSDRPGLGIELNADVVAAHG